MLCTYCKSDLLVCNGDLEVLLHNHFPGLTTEKMAEPPLIMAAAEGPSVSESSETLRKALLSVVEDPYFS